MQASSALILAPLAALALGLGACDDSERPASVSDRDASSNGGSTAPVTTADGRGTPADESGDSGSTGNSPLDVQVLDTVARLRPVVLEATSDVRDQWLIRRTATLEDMAAANEELGLALLDHLAEHPNYNEQLRRDLLEAGAIAAGPAASAELLELIETYAGNRLGKDLALRGRAAIVLGKSDPQFAFETLGRLMTIDAQGVTLPPMERLFEGFMEAVERTDNDPVSILAQLATALRMEQAVRHRSIEALGNYDGPLVKGALTQVLTESTGNTYMRIKAGQAVAAAFEKAEAIELLENVLEVEADTRMQNILLDLLRTLEP